jgi:peptidyl-dipeptidase Dcp
MVLSRGNTEEMAKMYRDFRGADPSVEYLLEDDGLKPEKTTAKAAPLARQARH